MANQFRTRFFVVGNMLLLSLSGCAGLAGPSETLPVSAAAVAPVPLIINELKCDYLDYKAYAQTLKGDRLKINKISGKIVFSLSRTDTNSIGVAVAIAPIKLNLGASASSEAKIENEVTIPFTIDPSLSGDEIDCTHAKRFNQPILSLRQLAEGIYASEAGAPKFAIGAAIKYKGQFYLKKSVGSDASIDVVFIKIDPAKLGRDSIYVQSFDIDIDTNGSQWFLDRLSPSDRARLDSVIGATLTRPGGAQPSDAPLKCDKTNGVTFCK